jgi:hypothetical protein
MNEAEQSQAAERAVARTLGRPLGTISAFVGAGLAVAAFASGSLACGILWTCLACWGLAARAIGREAARRTA